MCLRFPNNPIYLCYFRPPKQLTLPYLHVDTPNKNIIQQMCFEIFCPALARLFARDNSSMREEQITSDLVRRIANSPLGSRGDPKTMKELSRWEGESSFVVIMSTTRRAAEVFSRKLLPTSLIEVWERWRKNRSEKF